MDELVKEALTDVYSGVAEELNFFDLFSDLLGNISSSMQTERMVAIIGQGVNISKSLAIVFSIIAFIAILTLVQRQKALQSETTSIPQDTGPAPKLHRGPIMRRWEEILRHVESDRETEWKFAVIEADKLVDDILKKAGFPGETMGERLMSINKDQLQYIDALWGAHKLRNKIVHDSEFKVQYNQITDAIAYYEAVLEELGAII